MFLRKLIFSAQNGLKTFHCLEEIFLTLIYLLTDTLRSSVAFCSSLSGKRPAMGLWARELESVLPPIFPSQESEQCSRVRQGLDLSPWKELVNDRSLNGCQSIEKCGYFIPFSLAP